MEFEGSHNQMFSFLQSILLLRLEPGSGIPPRRLFVSEVDSEVAAVPFPVENDGFKAAARKMSWKPVK